MFRVSSSSPRMSSAFQRRPWAISSAVLPKGQVRSELTMSLEAAPSHGLYADLFPFAVGRSSRFQAPEHQDCWRGARNIQTAIYGWRTMASRVFEPSFML